MSASRVAHEPTKQVTMTSVRRENQVKLAAVSLSASSPDGDDAPYLQWHQLDHMVEQYQIPGMLHAQRWASTPECRQARAVQTERFEPVNHVVHYLFGEPVVQAIDDWFTLGADLHRVDRFPFRLPSVMLGAFDVVECHAAPSAQVTPEVVPHRPNRGVYVVIDQPDDPGAPPVWSPQDVDALLALDGVAGMWTFKSGTVRPDRFDQSGYHVALCYLDRDPLEVAGALSKIVTNRWNDVRAVPQFAAPFVAIPPFGWANFAHP